MQSDLVETNPDFHWLDSRTKGRFFARYGFEHPKDRAPHYAEAVCKNCQSHNDLTLRDGQFVCRTYCWAERLGIEGLSRPEWIPVQDPFWIVEVGTE